MRKSKKRGSPFRGGVSKNARKQSRGAMYGHLKLPKGVSIFKEEPKSRVDLDFLPYEVTDPKHPDKDEEYGFAMPGTLWYKRPYWLHRNVGANNESLVCPSSIKEPCPICEHRINLLKEGVPWDDDSVKAIKPKMRNLYAVIPKKNKSYEEVPHVWEISQFLFQDKLNEEIQEDEEYETFPDLEEGYTLRVRFSESQLGSNKFAEASRIDFKERGEVYDESILEDVPCLDDMLEILSYKAIDAMFFGGADSDEVEEEEEGREDAAEEAEEEKPKPKPKSRPERKRKKKARQEPECPHGHTFGDDCEAYDDCDKCDQWEDCLEVYES